MDINTLSNLIYYLHHSLLRESSIFNPLNTYGLTRSHFDEDDDELDRLLEDEDDSDEDEDELLDRLLDEDDDKELELDEDDYEQVDYDKHFPVERILSSGNLIFKTNSKSEDISNLALVCFNCFSSIKEDRKFNKNP